MADRDCTGTSVCTNGVCVTPAECTDGQTRGCGPAAMGACHPGTQRCVGGHFESACQGAVGPTAEQCNGVDDDCNGLVDDGAGTLWFVDADGDGYGSSLNGAARQTACTKPAGFADTNTDCDDSPGTGFSVHPGAPELCDLAGLDENCNGTINENCGCPTIGQTKPCCSGRGVQTCEAHPGGASFSMCSVAATVELCNGQDDDCDGVVDNGARLRNPDGGTLPIDGGATALPDGTCRVGVGACGATGATSCSSGALACGVGPGQPHAEVCNGADDNCDGRVDEAGPGLCAIASQVCTNGTCGCPVGQSICNGACVTLSAEICDGLDNNCDGQIDENVTIACAADPDGDGYATSAALTQQCPTSTRPQAGNCPLGYVAPAQSLGLDCNPSNGALYRLVASRADADNDGFCAGAVSGDCVGAAALPGRKFATACQPTDDCNDANNGLYRLMDSRADADVDGYCAGAAALDCVGGTALPGRRFTANCNQPDDCNDAVASVFRLASVRTDADNDGWCNGNASTQCIGSSPPAGQRLTTGCQGDDCNDANNQAGSACVLPLAYTTTTHGYTCPNAPQTTTLNVVNACPIGFSVAGTWHAEKLNGNGFCTANSETVITQSCNFLEGSTCRVVGDCVAFPLYP